MLKARIISSLEKPFVDEPIEKYPRLAKISALAGETFSFQLAYTFEIDEENRAFLSYSYSLSGKLAEYTTVREVKSIGVQKPVGIKSCDNYLRTAPGLYPDVLVTSGTQNRFTSSDKILNSLWIDVALPEDCSALEGESELAISLTRISNSEPVSRESIIIDVINHNIGEEKTLYTQWFSPSVVSQLYGVKPWSERHWEITEEYLRSSRRGGTNVIFTPAFELIRITKTARGFSYNYKNFDRWISMANRLGFKYIEIPHLFSAGNATSAGRITYYENGERRITQGMRSDDPEYVKIMRAALSAIIRRMKAIDDPTRLLFHIADEPALASIDTFRASRNSVIDIIGEYQIIDAIFDIEYWREGLVTSPVPITDHIEPFLTENIPNLWTYYCCGPQSRYSNRFIAQSGACTRSIGIQLYKYHITGFLHWALISTSAYPGSSVNPMLDQSGVNWVPAGDTCIVYPNPNGTPYESIRHAILRDAFQDIRAMQTAEKYYSHEKIVAEIEEILGAPIEFSSCVKDSETMLRIREKINELIRCATAEAR